MDRYFLVGYDDGKEFVVVSIDESEARRMACQICGSVPSRCEEISEEDAFTR